MTYVATCEGSLLAGPSHCAEVEAVDNLCAACRKLTVERALTAPTEWLLFAMRRDEHLEHFFGSTVQLTMCGDYPIYLVRLTLNPESSHMSLDAPLNAPFQAVSEPYWGWRYSYHPNNRSNMGAVSMVWHHRQLVEMCFPCGSVAETKRGRGEVVCLRVEVVRPARHPENVRDLEGSA